MKSTTRLNIQQIEAQARALRAEAMRDGARAVKRWVTARLTARHPGQTRTTHS